MESDRDFLEYDEDFQDDDSLLASSLQMDPTPAMAEWLTVFTVSYLNSKNVFFLICTWKHSVNQSVTLLQRRVSPLSNNSQ